MTFLLILLGLVVVFLLYGVTAYNNLVRRKTSVEEGWSGIETQLKRRANLIPNLVETVKGYAAHERGTLEEVTSLRAQTLETQGIAARGQKEGQLSAALGRLFAVAESYPELKANDNFLNLQKDLAETEDQIQMARRYYNGTVRNLNISVDTFPSNLVASAFSFQKAEFFEIENSADRAVPEVSFNS